MSESDVQTILKAFLKSETVQKKIHEEMKDAFIAHAEEDKVNAEILKDYIASDVEWKKLAQPTIELGKNMAGFGKVALYVMGFVALLASVVFAIGKIFKS